MKTVVLAVAFAGMILWAALMGHLAYQLAYWAFL